VYKEDDKEGEEMLEVEVQGFESSGEQDNVDLVIGKAWK
jgi:hypothetical protein